MVTDGIYGRIRHPQYVGILSVTVGYLIQWTSLTTLAMWPILMFAFHRLAKREEKKLEAKFGQEFLWYKREVPAYFPWKFNK